MKSKRKEAPANVGSKIAPEAQPVLAKPAKSKPAPKLTVVAPSVLSKSTSNITPTVEIASELQQAFDHFNSTLFNGVELPQVILSLARLKKAAGMFWPKRWVRDRSKVADKHEIGLDPIFLRGTDDKFGLSVLVHEMVHELIEVRGHAPKKAYHCKRWAEAMNAVGLKPVAIKTDKNTKKDVRIEGKETGPRCTHDVVKGGEFDVAAEALIAKGFKFSWAAIPEPEKVKKDKTKKAGVKVKYTADCDTSFWGKGGIIAVCQCGCKSKFVSEDGDGDE